MKINKKDVNILDIINEFNPEKYRIEGENKLNFMKNMLLDYSTFLLKKLDVLNKKEHICNGGTCAAGCCEDIGKITKCDTGCTYPG